MGRPPFQLVRIISTESESKTRNFINVVCAGDVKAVFFMAFVFSEGETRKGCLARPVGLDWRGWLAAESESMGL